MLFKVLSSVAFIFFACRIPPDFAAVIYAVGIQQGGEKEWDKLWEESQITRVASESELMMNALAYTQKPWLLWRYKILLCNAKWQYLLTWN